MEPMWLFKTDREMKGCELADTHTKAWLLFVLTEVEVGRLRHPRQLFLFCPLVGMWLFGGGSGLAEATHLSKWERRIKPQTAGW